MVEKNDCLQDRKILLHVCCGICAAYPVFYLKDAGYTPILYFYNPNIYPKAEYYKRLDNVEILANYFNYELIVGVYEPEIYYEFVAGLENEPEKGKRCDKCFELRLEKTAQKARELDIPEITTSMVISPHKNYEKLTLIGENIAKKYELVYNSTNFRKKDGFLRTNQISKSLNLYRQNYCGCKFAKL